MNFNFNFKDMPPAAEASIRGVTTVSDRHHTGKSGIKRSPRRGRLLTSSRRSGSGLLASLREKRSDSQLQDWWGGD